MDIKYVLILLVGWVVISLVACVREDIPSNRPPLVSADSAIQVTRVSALLVGTLEIPANSRVDFCRFCYGTAPDRIFTADCPLESGVVTARLDGLEPGTTYFYYLEAGTEAHRVISAMREFTTVPNQPPVLEAVVIEGQGPFSAVVSSGVVDDGGMEVTGAGFEYAVGDEKVEVEAILEGGRFSVRIAALKPHTAYTLRAFAENAIGRAYSEPVGLTTGDAFVWREPGLLSQLVDEAHKYRVQEMVLAGPLNGSDIRLLRDMGGMSISGAPTQGRLATLDMTDASIVEGGASYDGQHYTVDRVVGNGMFKGCPILKEVYLPYDAVALEVDAFAGCMSLERLVVGESLKSLVPSSGCPALAAIEVVGANPYFTSLQGILYDKEGTGLLWYPLGKMDEHLTLSPSLLRLGDYVLQGCRARKIDLPASLRELGIGTFCDARSLETLVIPSGVESLPTAVFQHCAALRSVTLGKGIAYLGEYCWDGCQSLTDLYVEAELPPVCETYAFAGVDDLYDRCVLHVPARAVDIYRNHPMWGKFRHIVPLGEP